MKIQSATVYRFLLYALLITFMLGPALPYHLGIPRPDNPMTLLFIILSLLTFSLEKKDFPTKIVYALLPLTIMSGWSLLHLLLSPISATLFADLMLFAVLPCCFYMLYLVISRHTDPLAFCQRFLACFGAFIIIPSLIELTTGFQFVMGDELFSLEDGTLKGLFFNPNNLCTTALCLSPAILFFFILLGRDRKTIITGWLMILLLGLVIFASASRTAILCYLLLLFLYTVYRGNALATIFTLSAASLIVYAMPSEIIQNFLLSLDGNQFLERFSSRLYLFLYDLDNDNSVSYRQEIYNHFWNHPPALYTGYGPRNFREYFGGHLSNSIGFTNPHSFMIEVYLAFGLISFAAFWTYVAVYLYTVVEHTDFPSKIRFIAACSMMLFLAAGFIPSTIMRLPFIWLPGFMMLIYMQSHRNHLKTGAYS